MTAASTDNTTRSPAEVSALHGEDHSRAPHGENSSGLAAVTSTTRGSKYRQIAKKGTNSRPLFGVRTIHGEQVIRDVLVEY